MISSFKWVLIRKWFSIVADDKVFGKSGPQDDVRA